MTPRSLTVIVDHTNHDLTRNIIDTSLDSYGIEHRVVEDDWDADDEEAISNDEETP